MDELDSLAGLAAAADLSAEPAGAPGAAPAEAEAAQHVPGPDEQAADLIQGFASVLAGFAPETAEIWTPQACQVSATAIAPLLVKYNISLLAIPPELSAAIIVGPLLYRSAVIVGDKIKAKRAAKGQPAAPQPAGAPNAAGVADAAGQSVANAPGAVGEAPAVAIHPQMALYQ